jgi:hypothetical protein
MATGILITALDGDEWPDSRPGSFSPKETPVQVEDEGKWSPGLVDML